MQIGDQKRARVVKQIFMPYVPLYDEAKTEIISMSAGKSVDMTDINYAWIQHRKLKLNLIMGRENRFKNLQTRLKEQTNLCKLEAITLQDF